MKKYFKKNVSIYVLLALLHTAFVFSQDSETSYRTAFSLEKKITKKFSIELTPEVRYDQNFEFSSYLIKTSLDYKFNKWLSAGAQYRLKGLQSDTDEGSEIDYSNRFAFDATTKIKIDRFTPKFRLQFSNYSDFDNETEDKTNYLRYRFGTDYSIKGSKITPYASIEFFQKMSNGLISKTRYSLGAEYKLNKHNALEIGYALDQKHKKEENNNIVELNYKYKF